MVYKGRATILYTDLSEMPVSSAMAFTATPEAASLATFSRLHVSSYRKPDRAHACESVRERAMAAWRAQLRMIKYLARNPFAVGVPTR